MRFTFTRFLNSPGRILLLLFVIVVPVVIYYGLTVGGHVNELYTYQQSYKEHSKEGTQYRIALVADMDKASRITDSNKWKSKFKHGVLTRGAESTYSVEWKDEYELVGLYNEGGRGMELSDLAFFNGKLYTCDDRSGIVYEIDTQTHKAWPRHVFTGDSNQEKGFKCEWMTVKDDTLYIGSMGKKWTDSKGNDISNDPLWVKKITVDGKVSTEDWSYNYQQLDKAVNNQSTRGYMVHEAVNWDHVTQQWFFLPRRVSTESYDEATEGEKGANIGFIASEDFSKVVVKQNLGELKPTHGFSSFKFVPYRHHEIVVLKTVENGDVIETYIMVYDLEKNLILMPEEKVASAKYEGVEFI